MKTLFVLCMSVVLFLFGNIDLRTTIRSGDYQGANELIGTVAFNITGDDVNGDLPVYIRVLLGKGAIISQSLVEPGQTPINLAVAISGPTSGHQINLQPEAITLVRANSGENQLWIKLDFQTDSAISLNGEFVIPSPELSLRFSLGDSIEHNSAVNGPRFDVGQANLPCNQLSGENIDTSLYVDLSNSILEAIPNPDSELNIDPVIFDNTTSGVENSQEITGIIIGNQLGVAFSGDNIVFRGEYGENPTKTSFVPHVARLDSRFDTFIDVHNDELQEFTAIFSAQDESGVELETVEVSVSDVLERFHIGNLFPNLEVARIEIEHHLFSTVSFGYESEENFINSSPFMAEKLNKQQFKLSLIQSPSVFDGVVFTLDHPTLVTFTFYDNSGNTKSLELNLERNKEVISLNDLEGYDGAHGVKIALSRPASIVHLRRLILEGGHEYLFPVQPILQGQPF